VIHEPGIVRIEIEGTPYVAESSFGARPASSPVVPMSRALIEYAKPLPLPEPFRPKCRREGRGSLAAGPTFSSRQFQKFGGSFQRERRRSRIAGLSRDLGPLLATTSSQPVVGENRNEERLYGSVKPAYYLCFEDRPVPVRSGPSFNSCCDGFYVLRLQPSKSGASIPLKC
jgi:hypothetical protein